MKKPTSLLEHRKNFNTVNACLWYLLELRGRTDQTCLNPYCKCSVKKYYTPLRGRKALMCRRCLGHFYPMVDSIFQKSHLPINLVFEIIFLMLSSRNSVSAREIERNFSIGYPSVHRIMHQIRDLMGKLYKCKIFDVTGSIVKTITFEGKSYRLDNLNLSKGFYFLTIESGSTLLTDKIIIQ